MTIKNVSSFHRCFTSIALLSVFLQMAEGLDQTDGILRYGRQATNKSNVNTQRATSSPVVIPTVGSANQNAKTKANPTVIRTSVATVATMAPTTIPNTTPSPPPPTTVVPTTTAIDTTPEPSTTASTPKPAAPTSASLPPPTQSPKTRPPPPSPSPPLPPPTSSAPTIPSTDGLSSTLLPLVTSSVATSEPTPEDSTDSNADVIPSRLKCVDDKIFPPVRNISSSLCTKLIDQVNGPENDWRTGNYVVLIVFLILLIVSGVLGFVTVKKNKRGKTASHAHNVTLLPPAQPVGSVERSGEQKGKKTPRKDSTTDNPSSQSQKLPKVLMTQQLIDSTRDIEKLRQHVNKVNAQHKVDTDENNFVKKGPIFIPKNPEIPPPATGLPENVVIEKVSWDLSGNEIFDIGSLIDDVELEKTSSASGLSTLSVDEEATRQALSTTHLVTPKEPELPKTPKVPSVPKTPSTPSTRKTGKNKKKGSRMSAERNDKSLKKTQEE